MKGYNYLAISIVGEVFATTMLKLSKGFTVFFPSLFVVAGYLLSFYFLALCLKSIPLSIAYAIWAGAGTALVALIGVLIWGEVPSVVKLFGIVLIIGGVVMLNAPRKITETIS